MSWTQQLGNTGRGQGLHIQYILYWFQPYKPYMRDEVFIYLTNWVMQKYIKLINMIVS